MFLFLPPAAMEENICSLATVGACGFIYLCPKEQFPAAEAGLLSNRYKGGKACTLPLLRGLTVESDFDINVKSPCQKVTLDAVTVKLSTYHREVIVFHGAEIIPEIFHGVGLEDVCRQARSLFGYTGFDPRPDTCDVTAAQLLKEECGSDFIAWVAIAEGFKERLYSGSLVALKNRTCAVQINEAACLKIPLFDERFMPPSDENVRFYNQHVSRMLFECFYTNVAQAVRIKDVGKMIQLLEERVVQDLFKTAKFSQLKDYPKDLPAGPAGSLIKLVDATVTELALSHGLSFLEAPQEPGNLIEYLQWPIFQGVKSDKEKLLALEDWNAKQALHVYAQLLSTNSVLYLNRVARAAAKNPSGKAEDTSLNAFFLQHGLAFLNSQTRDEIGNVAFPGIPEASLSGTQYTLHHLAYAAFFSPNNLARVCYYLQMCQHQKLTGNSSFDIPTYVGTTANSHECPLCEGHLPAVCINTLFYRVKDRFPQVTTPQRRDPYVITGVSGTYNDLEVLGTFANFKEKDDEGDTASRYTYWKLNSVLTEKLQDAGITADTDPKELITDPASFVSTFKLIDKTVDGELVAFAESMAKQNMNYRENVKSACHVLQLQCNPYWLPPCTTLLQIYYRSFLILMQDLTFPLVMTHEQENPFNYGTVSTWLGNHFQTLWGNFKNCWFDKGLFSCTDYRIQNQDTAVDLPNPQTLGTTDKKLAIRMSRAQIYGPKVFKIKNRILFSNSPGTESLMANFLKVPKKENCITNGPYIKFLFECHKTLFPETKMGAYYTWQTFSTSKQLPRQSCFKEEDIANLAQYVKLESEAFEDTNVLDHTPSCFISYAKQRLNNGLLKLCGQTQFYATLVNCLLPSVVKVGATEYPHVLGECRITEPADYHSQILGKRATVVQTSLNELCSQVFKLRPIITVPISVNKYFGTNGNNSIFQSANMGYFMGRGVDRRLLPDTHRGKRTINTSMRKRFIFTTPLVHSLVAQATKTSSQAFEVEKIRQKLVDFILRGNETAEAVACEIVANLGPACCTLTLDDVSFFLSDFNVMSEPVFEILQSLVEKNVSLEESTVKSLLLQPLPEDQPSLITINTTDTQPTTSPTVHQVSTIPSSKKTKKLEFMNTISL
ncbi:single-stranded DNA binding protein [Cricetid gammaherpesvirus 2]|uniref:Single-stranded DNA binding protein n=1 Tax=Cricetid gammaherpesvirus 2 TaxID=1605972 RepID=E9M5J3_9GAMA|nr:single-stranded DNA binding protein [Cricetid gammaherpesvirus 2]ADW24351.1 single-stranded DNA binding protein [Cricetid gammaherpesvirus 2]ADW24433.1 single-stranded DNA binding protein [Cricetid gammaherpesvirus 2]